MSLYDVLLARALTPQSGGGDTSGLEERGGTATAEATITFGLSIAEAQNGLAEIYLSDMSALGGQTSIDDGRPRVVGMRCTPSGVWLTTVDQNGISQDTDAYDPGVLEWGDNSVTMTGDLQVNSGAVFVENASYEIFYRG